VDSVSPSLSWLTTHECFELQVFPWPSLGTQEASVKTLRFLEGPFSAQVDRGDLKRATQLAIGILRSLELQKKTIVSKEDTSQVRTTFEYALHQKSIIYVH